MGGGAVVEAGSGRLRLGLAGQSGQATEGIGRFGDFLCRKGSILMGMRRKKHREFEKKRFPMPDEMLFLLYKKKKA